jgi:hypothetical protein
LIAGKFEWIYLGKDALMRMLGAPAADKKAFCWQGQLTRPAEL